MNIVNYTASALNYADLGQGELKEPNQPYMNTGRKYTKPQKKKKRGVGFTKKRKSTRK